MVIVLKTSVPWCLFLITTTFSYVDNAFWWCDLGICAGANIQPMLQLLPGSPSSHPLVPATDLRSEMKVRCSVMVGKLAGEIKLHRPLHTLTRSSSTRQTPEPAIMAAENTPRPLVYARCHWRNEGRCVSSPFTNWFIRQARGITTLARY